MGTEGPKLDPIKFLLGGISGMITVFIFHPLDFLKNRMQFDTGAYTSSVRVAKRIFKNEGPLAFYSGLSAGLMRQTTYTAARVGFYAFLREMYTDVEGKPPGSGLNAGLGMVAGAMGAFIGNPAEIVLIRMTTDGSLPPSKRRNYSNAYHAIYRIAKYEGFKTLWVGAIPTVIRCMVTNTIQVIAYAEAKEIMLYEHICGYDGLTCQMASAMVSGLFSSVFSLPLDIIKARIQSMNVVYGKTPAPGMMEVLQNIIQNEGVWALWKGFGPYYARAGPHSVLLFILFERFISEYELFLLKYNERKTL